ncbi:MAG: acetyl-CoA carboxylase biotin carboxyl carrier protein subunit [Ignavibacteria bacterium]|nr:acetyl-CoA carboxylase biotin carboxyl carrier protein subunit [Ignavibacteria bacterium]
MKKLRITVNGKEYEVEVEVLEDTDSSSGPQLPFVPPVAQVTPMTPPSTAFASEPRQKGAFKASTSASDANSLTSPMNGVVIEVPVKPGDSVKEGQVVVILEAMKMKTNISSSRDGVIADIKVKVNDSVESGQVLLTYK